MTQMENYYTPEQLEGLQKRRVEVGEDRIRAVETAWNDLFAEFRQAMDRGDDPASEPVLALARQARALIAEFTGGDKGIERSLGNLYANEPSAKKRIGVEPELWTYMTRARGALGG